MKKKITICFVCLSLLLVLAILAVDADDLHGLGECDNRDQWSDTLTVCLVADVELRYCFMCSLSLCSC